MQEARLARLLEQAHKNLYKFRFYISRVIELQQARFGSQAWRLSTERSLRCINDKKLENLLHRLSYYNRLTSTSRMGEAVYALDDLPGKGSKTQALDLRHVIQYFPYDLRFNFELGDITELPNAPTFLKSRPIVNNNQDAILLKINEVRHYYWRKDPYKFREKWNSAVWRGACHQPHRRSVLSTMKAAQLVDAGDVRRAAEGTLSYQSFLSPRAQMRYKFIISLEGNDVATNLKWIMRSNSLCLMPKPNYESWFMEGRLRAGEHYVEMPSEPEAIDSLIEYYSAHPDEASTIIQNANSFAKQFYDSPSESLLQRLVALKYFILAGQLTVDPRLPEPVRLALSGYA